MAEIGKMISCHGDIAIVVKVHEGDVHMGRIQAREGKREICSNAHKQQRGARLKEAPRRGGYSSGRAALAGEERSKNEKQV